ncbi:MAG: CotH kinase family protein [Verrucomicrobiales bacterium]|nr:CotH kinase family protein [Verrucomicrobiales bacterium]
MPILLIVALFFSEQRADSNVVISEIMAVADLNYPDDDGEPSDWIELTNKGGGAISLAGHYLTNNSGDLTRWELPAVTLAGNSSILIYASGKDRRNPAAALHASFTLDRGGDYLGLIAPDGVSVVSEIAPGYPEQFEGVSYGIGASGLVAREVVIPPDAEVNYLVPVDGSLGSSWQENGFDDSNWKSAPHPVGFESATGALQQVLVTDISSDMKGVNAGGYFRFPFQFDGNDRNVVSARLNVTVDDGYVAYLNGLEVARAYAPQPAVWNSRAIGGRQDGIVISEQLSTDLSAFTGAIVDGTNVLSVHAMNTSPGSSDFLIGVELLADVQDTSAGAQYGFFRDPTPATPNAIVFGAPPEEVLFSRPGGLFEEDFDLELSCATPGATIRYTTDLSLPSNELGQESTEYTGPIRINGSTQIRAAAYYPGALDGPTGTSTYIEASAQVLNFSSNLPVVVMTTLGTGSPPASSATTRKTAYMFFYEPDPETGRTSLREVAALGSRAGIRKRGSSSSGWPKYAMSVETWNDGDDEDRNIKPLGFSREADWILSARYQFDRALMRNPLIYDLSRQAGRYAVRTKFVEVFNDVTGGELNNTNDYFGVYTFMEKVEADENRVEVERLMPWENAAPEVTGGYIFKRDRNDAGSPPTYSVNGSGGSLIPHDPGGEEVTAQQKAFIQGYLNEMNTAIVNRSGGGVNPQTGLHFSDYLDVGSFIDHHWLNVLAMNVDWGRLSAYYHKHRVGLVHAGPIWDFDRTMGSEDSRDDNPRQWDGSGDSSRTWMDSRYPWFGNLIGPTSDPATAYYPEVRQRHTDRWFELRRGVLSTENINRTIDGMADELREAQQRNFARWAERSPNGGNFQQAGTGGWEAEVSHLKGWLKARAEWIDTQYLAPPEFNHPGGVVEEGFALLMTGDGPVYFTLDGSDPRAVGGGISDSAIPFEGGAINTTLLGGDVPFSYHVPADAGLGTQWTALDFDDSPANGWGTGSGGVGWESAGGTLDPFVDTNISAEVRGINTGAYFRYEFDFENAQNINAMTLNLLIDDGFVAYLNGVEVASFNAPNPVSYNSRATGGRADSQVVQGLTRNISAAGLDAMVNGRNVLAIHAMNTSLGGSDLLVLPELTINHTVSSQALRLDGAVTVTARVRQGAKWSAATQVEFVAGVPAASGENLVVSEIMYRPTPPTPEERAAGHDDRDLFEYIELLNISADEIALLGCRFTDGVDYGFDSGSPGLLGAGQRILIVRDRDAFAYRYGEQAALRVAGEFAEGTGLSNDGESIAIEGVSGLIREFTYNDKLPWPEAADGDGFSLVLLSPESNPDHNIAENWGASRFQGGSPGEQEPGGQSFSEWAESNGGVAPGSDSDRDGRSALLEYAMGTDPNSAEPSVELMSGKRRSIEVDGDREDYLVIEFTRSLDTSGVVMIPELSPGLEQWGDTESELVMIGEQDNGDGTSTVSYRTVQPLKRLPGITRFFRIRVDLP